MAETHGNPVATMLDSTSGNPTMPKSTDGAVHVYSITPKLGLEQSSTDIDDATATISFNGTADTDTLANRITGLIGGDTVQLHATEDCFIRFSDGANAATAANSMFFAKGTQPWKIKSDTTHMSVISNGTDGKLYMTKVV